jgi:hypothetical protein
LQVVGSWAWRVIYLIFFLQCPCNGKLDGYSGLCELRIGIVCPRSRGIRLFEDAVSLALLIIKREVHFVRKVFLHPTSSSAISRLSSQSCRVLFMDSDLSLDLCAFAFVFRTRKTFLFALSKVHKLHLVPQL